MRDSGDKRLTRRRGRRRQLAQRTARWEILMVTRSAMMDEKLTLQVAANLSFEDRPSE